MRALQNTLRRVLHRALQHPLQKALLLSALIANAGASDPFIILQSTTSTANSGLYDAILPAFTASSGIQVRVVAVGTGQAIRNARNGDGDVLLVHAKSAEEQFVSEGFGVKRFNVMYNDFVVVGPPSDPAGIAGLSDASTAFARIARVGAVFASRGDNSGTHKKELALWHRSGVDVDGASGSWYRETGQGMGATLNVAVGMGAYALTDRATWISFKNKANFTIAVQGGADLFNQYGVMLVNPVRHAHVKAEAGQAFIDWLRSDAGQAAIASYQLGGQQLFFPNAQPISK